MNYQKLMDESEARDADPFYPQNSGDISNKRLLEDIGNATAVDVDGSRYVFPEHPITSQSNQIQSRSISGTRLIALAMAVILTNSPVSEAAPKDFIEKFSAEGNKRTIVVSGASLREIHDIAANHFVNNLERDFKDTNKFYAVRNFVTTAKKTKAGYEMTYSLELVPVNKNQKHFRIVDMRGTVIDGIKSKQTAEDINRSKVPQWQKSMSGQYVGMQYLQAISQNGPVYHEAFIGLGESKK